MRSRRPRGRRFGHPGTALLAVLTGLSWLASPAAGQTETPTPLAELSLPPPFATVDADVIQTGCGSCGGGGGGVLGLPPVDGPGGLDGLGGCGCGANPPCAGRKPCYPCDGDNAFSRFCCCLYQCICCKDPCYEGRWTPLADAGFFVATARPVTQQRLRWDYGPNVVFPDRAEFFWAAPPVVGGRGPVSPYNPAAGVLAYATPSLTYNRMSLYTEVASKAFSFFIDMPYMSYNPSIQPSSDPVLAHHAGFGDISLGTKSLLYDCELLQLGFMFTTFIPSGNFAEGLGTGHVSLEPTMLLDVKLGPETYFEGQISEWIPLGGTPGYQGAVLHYHTSVNQTLWRPIPNVPIVGTCEFDGWSFQTGSYTSPWASTPADAFYQTAGNYSYLYVGGGLRMFICDKIDFGVGVDVPITSAHWADPLIRSEFRWRF